MANESSPPPRILAAIPKPTDILNAAEVPQQGTFAQRFEIANTRSGEQISLW